LFLLRLLFALALLRQLLRLQQPLLDGAARAADNLRVLTRQRLLLARAVASLRRGGALGLDVRLGNRFQLTLLGSSL
jgi:hypothetical protein